jgi:hypothetical protein
MFRIVTKEGNVLDVEGDSNKGNSWKKNGQKINVKPQNYDKDKMWQFELRNGNLYQVDMNN